MLKPESDVVEPESVARDGLTPEERKAAAAERAKTFTEAEQKRYEAKKAKRAEKKVQKQPAAVVRGWVREMSDSLVIASHYDPEAVLLALLPYLGYSKPFVIYSEYLEVRVGVTFYLCRNAKKIPSVRVRLTFFDCGNAAADAHFQHTAENGKCD